MKLIRTGRVALAFTLPDTAWDAYNGTLKGLNEKVGVRSLMALYSTSCTLLRWMGPASRVSPT